MRRFANGGLTSSGMWLAGLACAALMASVTVASADPPPNVLLDAPGLLMKKPRPGLPDVKAQPLAWPRLDPGAAFCRTEEDLARLAARRSGDANAGPADCRIITAATPVTIVERKSLGRTEVQVSGADNVTGWTDVWLPAKGPATSVSLPGR